MHLDSDYQKHFLIKALETAPRDRSEHGIYEMLLMQVAQAPVGVTQEKEDDAKPQKRKAGKGQ